MAESQPSTGELLYSMAMAVFDNLGDDYASKIIQDRVADGARDWADWALDIFNIEDEFLLATALMREEAIAPIINDMMDILSSVTSSPDPNNAVTYRGVRQLILHCIEFSLVVSASQHEHLAMTVVDKGFADQSMRLISTMTRDVRWTKEELYTYFGDLKKYCTTMIKQVKAFTPRAYKFADPMPLYANRTIRTQTVEAFFDERYRPLLPTGLRPHHIRLHDPKFYNALTQLAYRRKIKLTDIFYFSTTSEDLVEEERQRQKDHAKPWMMSKDGRARLRRHGRFAPS